jgi:hypothetical protein
VENCGETTDERGRIPLPAQSVPGQAADTTPIISEVTDRNGSDRFGGDRYGSDRYGSDRDTSVSAAQAERDWQEWQEFVRHNPRYGSNRYGMEPAQ